MPRSQKILSIARLSVAISLKFLHCIQVRSEESLSINRLIREGDSVLPHPLSFPRNRGNLREPNGWSCILRQSATSMPVENPIIPRPMTGFVPPVHGIGQGSHSRCPARCKHAALPSHIRRLGSTIKGANSDCDRDPPPGRDLIASTKHILCAASNRQSSNHRDPLREN